MSKINVGVKFPDVGTPDSVEGIDTRTGGVGVGLGVGEGLMVADGVAVFAGTLLSPAACTTKLLVTFFTIPATTVDTVIVCSPGSRFPGTLYVHSPLLSAVSVVVYVWGDSTVIVTLAPAGARPIISGWSVFTRSPDLGVKIVSVPAPVASLARSNAPAENLLAASVAATSGSPACIT